MKKSEYLLLIGNIYIATGLLLNQGKIMAAVLAVLWTVAGVFVSFKKEGKDE